MSRISWLAFLATLAASHVEDPKACIEAPANDDSDISSLLSIAVSSKRQRLPAFASFIQQHNRVYTEGTPEYEHRLSIFERRAREAQLLNERPARLWTAGVNHLSDWTDEELSRLRGWKGTASRRSDGATVSTGGSGLSLLQKTGTVALKSEVSWTHLNASKVVHNQGGCGSCWAFASALMLEANHEIHQKQARTFSPQELVNCVANTHNCGGSGGCNGATVELAMDYAIKHGLDDNNGTPYAGVDMPCSKDLSLVGGGEAYPDDLDLIFTPGLHSASHTSKGLSAFGLMGWERLPENKYEPLMRAVAEHGPVAVSAAASPWSSYIDGIFDGCDADAVINHAVTLVGYGKDDELKEKFWLIQNSWGPNWGEQGRIRILRRDDDDTQCGTDRQPEDGTACDGGPTQVTVCGMCGILYDTVVAHFSKVD